MIWAHLPAAPPYDQYALQAWVRQMAEGHPCVGCGVLMVSRRRSKMWCDTCGRGPRAVREQTWTR